MAKLTNNERVARLYEKHGLTRPEIAELARVSRGAVDRWLRPAGTPHYRHCPDGPLELLMLKLGEKPLVMYKRCPPQPTT